MPPVAFVEPQRIQEGFNLIVLSLSLTTNAQLITLGDKNAFRSGSNAMQIYEPGEANINLESDW